MKTKLLDVTENARKDPTHVPGWRIAVTQRVWDRCVAEPNGGTKEDEEERLLRLLTFMWHGFTEVNYPKFGLVAGFGFDTGYSYPNPKDPPPARLAAVAGIDPGGAPQIVVLLPKEIASSPRRLR